MHTYIHIHVYIYVYAYIYTYIYIHTCTIEETGSSCRHGPQTNTQYLPCIFTHIYIHTCTYIYVYIYLHAYMHNADERHTIPTWPADTHMTFAFNRSASVPPEDAQPTSLLRGRSPRVRAKVLQCFVVCVAAYCSVLRCAVACCPVHWTSPRGRAKVLQLLLQCVAVCCSVLQCVARFMERAHVSCKDVAICTGVAIVVACVAVCCSVLKCVAVCVAVCYSVL